MASYYIALSLHILGATIWAGGHLILATTILPRALREHRAAAVSEFERSFERIGLPALAVQIVTGRGVPLKRSDVDTDQIIPAEWLKRVERTGFEKGLFCALSPRMRSKVRPSPPRRTSMPQLHSHRMHAVECHSGAAVSPGSSMSRPLLR